MMEAVLTSETSIYSETTLYPRRLSSSINEEDYNIYSAPSIVKVNKLKRTRYTGLIECTGPKNTVHSKCWLRNLKTN
jgi:hypothetical protein